MPDPLPGLLDQGFDLVRTPDLNVTSTGPERPDASQQVTAVARVGPEEDAVLLVEQDGVWTWHSPQDRTEVRPVRGAAGSDTAPVAREITFVLEVGDRRAPLVGDLVRAGARLFVLKFLAPTITERVMEHLESGITPRLLQITRPDPTTWSPVPAGLEVKGPRVLLFVHGTFSSTRGDFGHLASHPSGVSLLTSALAHYDAVLGYDHKTLSLDPLQNAAELVGLLDELEWSEPPTIDIVTFSRGALVARSLVELVLPDSGFAVRTDRIVFAGGVNAGTELANPANWNRMLDLYTTLAAAAAELIGEPLAATIASEAIRGVGAFAKAVISYAVQDDGVPGLAAMLPDGEFVKTLNQAQPGQPASGTTRWFVLGADFEPRLDVGLPRTLLDWVVDTGVDQLIGQANDLVVNTSSMGAIDVPPGTTSGYVRDSFCYPSTRGIHHTVYFHQPETADLIRDWLALPELTG